MDFNKTSLSRRKALLGAAVIGTGLGTSSVATAANTCLAAPDCASICTYGGTAKGHGTQECICNSQPSGASAYAEVCTTGSYNSLVDAPNLAVAAKTGNFNDVTGVPARAGSSTAGGDANDSELFGGWQLSLSSDNANTQIPVRNGSNINYVLRSEIASLYDPGDLSATYSGTKSGYTLSITRDSLGRVSSVAASYDSATRNCNNCTNCVDCNCDCNCDCDCQDCSDDSGCFVQTILKTTTGAKRVQDIKPGDILAGPDGNHTVVAIATNVLGSRHATTPANDHATVLTDDHILGYGDPGHLGLAIATTRALGTADKPIESDTGSKKYVGRYTQTTDGLEVKPEIFASCSYPPYTKTYSLIVDHGHWAETQNGTYVRVCEVCKE